MCGSKALKRQQKLSFLTDWVQVDLIDLIISFCESKLDKYTSSSFPVASRQISVAVTSVFIYIPSSFYT